MKMVHSAVVILVFTLFSTLVFVSGASENEMDHIMRFAKAIRDSKKVVVEGDGSKHKAVPDVLMEFAEDIEEASLQHLDDVHPNDHRYKLATDSLKRRNKREVISDPNRRWTNKTMRWRMETSNFNPFLLETVKNAIRFSLAELEARTCMLFPEIDERPDSGPYVSFIRIGTGCYVRSIGMNGDGVDERESVIHLSANPFCTQVPTIQHETLHRIGFEHEMIRPDRDDHLEIRAENVEAASSHNFWKAHVPQTKIFERAKYDLTSVMHYAASAASFNGAKVMQARLLEYESLIRSNAQSVSYYDELAINLAYDCADGCEDNCLNDGYMRKSPSNECSCHCPPYLAGERCETVDSSCGATYNMTSGETIYIQSENYPDDYRYGRCIYLITGPSDGHHLELEFLHLDLPTSCAHVFDIRKNMIGQVPIELLCGSGNPGIMTTEQSVSKDKMLIIFDAEDQSQEAIGSYNLKIMAVSNEEDSCASNPCHGVPCRVDNEAADGYICDYLETGFICGFETSLSGVCAAISMNKYYEVEPSPDMTVLPWSVSSGIEIYRPFSGRVFLMTYSITSNGYPAYAGEEAGSVNVAPHKMGGSVWCFEFHYALWGGRSFQVYLIINGVVGDPIRTVNSNTSGVYFWESIELNCTHLEPTDMIEVMIRAISSQPPSESEVIFFGLNEIILLPGVCPTDACAHYPCGASRSCQVTGDESYTCSSFSIKDAACGLEDNERFACEELVSIGSFVLNAGFTPSYTTGPSQAYSGIHYAYMEGTVVPIGGLPNVYYLYIQPYRGQRRKLSFWYHALGIHVNGMLISQSDDDGGSWSPLTTVVRGNQGDIWKYFEYDVINSAPPGDSAIQLRLEGYVGVSFRCDLAVDEIVYELITAACWDFEIGTNASIYGSNDHNDSGGEFVLSNQIIDSASPLEGRQFLLFKSNYPSSRFGDIVRFKLTEIDADGLTLCMNFHYILSGSGWEDGLFNIVTKQDDVENVLLSLTGETHQGWKQSSIQITGTTSGSPQIILEVILGQQPGLQALAVDVISLNQGVCGEIMPDTCRVPATSGSVSCGFEPGDDCSWLKQFGRGSWLTQSGSTPYYPRAGTNSGFQSDHYAIFVARDASRRTWVNLEIQEFSDSVIRCLQFYYVMYGSNVNTLEIVDTSENVLFRRIGNAGPGYKRAEVTIETQSKLYLRAMRSNGSTRANIIIDTLQYTDGAC